MTNSEDIPTLHSAFRFRIGSSADLPYCVPLLPPGFRADDTIRKKLVSVWTRLLASEAKTFCIVEDLKQDYPRGIEGFGLSVFVSDNFAAEVCASPKPYLAAQFYKLILAGEDDVLLAPERIAEANSTTGINVLVLHFGLRNHDLSDMRTAHALMAGSAGFFFFHSGYRIKMLINETYGPQSLDYMERGGFRLANDFHRESAPAFDSVPPEHHPYLFLLRREWVQPGAVNPLSQLFYPATPQLFFSAAERRVLERALLNESDAQIANNLAISIDRYKKTWRNVFARVNRVAPYLIPAAELEPSGARGQEKRRHLLDYLRTHLEELRPAAHSAPSQDARHPQDNSLSA